jgi:hypothetical protein
MPLILLLHLILDASVSIIRAYNEIPTKLFQHADDCSIISTEISEYDELIKEFKIFGQVSGSKINEQKTEILKKGNPDTINHTQYISVYDKNLMP